MLKFKIYYYFEIFDLYFHIHSLTMTTTKGPTHVHGLYICIFVLTHSMIA